MDNFLEVGRTPTLPKTPLEARQKPHSQVDATDQRRPPERQPSDSREGRSERIDRRENDAQRRADQKRESQDSAGRQSADVAETDHNEKTEETFLSHVAATEGDAEKAPAEKSPKGIELVKAPVKAIDFAVGAEKAASKAASPELVKGPLTEKSVQLELAKPVTAESVEILPTAEPVKPELIKTAPITAGIKAESVKKAPADIKAALTKTPVATQATVKTSDTVVRMSAMPQDLQSLPFSEVGAPLDLDSELKLQTGERLELRSASIANLKGMQTALNRMPSMVEMPPVFIPQGALALDPASSIDQNLELAALKQVSSTQSLQVTTMSAAAPTAQAQTAAATQLVAAIKAERLGNSNNIEVRLDPPELGRVRIDFSMETADAVKAVLTAERSETLDHLRRNMNDLMDQLRQAGFTSIDLEFSSQGSSDFEQNETAVATEVEGDAPLQHNDVIYLSLRDDAQVDLLV